ncbi:RL1D1 protein, partial [Oxylabes madagascariensis]|nr:RL1D1 protein [Oxylabes madagascariensis]
LTCGFAAVVPLQVKKAVEALVAFARRKAKKAGLLLNETDSIHLLVTVWKVPQAAKVIRIPLPHGIRPETADVCLFTRDEPNLSAEQTENLYKKLLFRNGIRSISRIISYKTLKKEYKMFEAKRRLLNSFDLFLSDDRIRRLLPSHLGKHFYERKKAPLSVNLKAKDLAKELEKHIQGTTLPVNNKGCCYTTRIGHTGMKVEEILENIIAAAKVIGDKLPKKWKNVKILHLKTLKSVALPIFNANISNLDELDKQPSLKINRVKKAKLKKVKKTAKKRKSKQVTVTPESKAAAGTQEPVAKEKVEIVQEPGDCDDEEIPQLVPIQTTSSADLKVIETGPSPEKGDNLGKKTETPLRKRKRPSLVVDTPKSKRKVTEECANLETSSKEKEAKQVSKPKEGEKEKDMKKTPKKPEAKSFTTPKAGKSIQSAKKSSKPKQAPKKVRMPQSA